MFINYTNHSSKKWSKKQMEKAQVYGEIIDIPFPQIDATFDKEKIYCLANNESDKILDLLKDNKDSSCVLCQGEFNFSFLVIKFLMENHVKVVSATSERIVKEVYDGDLCTKETRFVFEEFREYDARRKKIVEEDFTMSSYHRENKGNRKDKILIAQLGAASYQVTTYKNKEESVTCFSFDALVKEENPNKLFLIGTAASNWKMLLDCYSRIGSEIDSDLLDKIKDRLESVKRGNNDESIWHAVEDYIENAANFEQVRIAIVPDGKDREEINKYFDIIKDALEEIIDRETDTEILFDISYGYRSIPLYIMLLVKYFGLINKKSLSLNTYYGIYEGREGNVTPLVNLTDVSNLTEWINAISEFRNFGNVKELYKCLDEEKNRNDSTEIEKIISSFKRFDYALNSNNLYYLEECIHYIIDELDIAQSSLSEPAKLMLGNIQEDFRERFKVNTPYKYTLLMVKIAQLYTEQGRYGSAAAALQEGIITYSLERYFKKYICEDLNLDDKKFGVHLMDYKNREPIKNYMDNKIREKIREIKDELKHEWKYEFENSYPFQWYYLQIRNHIRNVEAHFTYKEEKQDFFDNMQEWLTDSIEIMLVDMGLINKTNAESKLEEIYSLETKTREEIRQIYTPKDTKGQKNDVKQKKTEKEVPIKIENIREDKNGRSEEIKTTGVGLNSEKLLQLSEEIGFVKIQCQKGKDITISDIKQRPMLEKVLELWLAFNGKAITDEGKVKLLITKYNKKGIITNGYERLNKILQINIKREEIMRMLMEP